MINIESLNLRYKPFPIGVAQNVMDPSFYKDLVSQWPAQNLFQYKDSLGDKYSLSEVNNPDNYQAFINSTPAYKKLHDSIKSAAFIYGLIDYLASRNIDLGYRQVPTANKIKSALRDIRYNKRWPRYKQDLSARFEFSMLPVDGGSIRPHTDAPQKIITIVLSIIDENEWPSDVGGGTQIVWPKDETKSFNRKNAYMDFSDVDVLDEYAFDPNQALLFVKTFNSWHTVLPMRGKGRTEMRKTLTINIEDPDLAAVLDY